MKDLLKKTMTKSEFAVLQQFILGQSEEEIVSILNKTPRTVRDARYKLLKLFNVQTINQLCLKAAQSGYANDFINKLDEIRSKTVIQKLGMRELLVLQFIFESLPPETIEKILPELPEREEDMIGIDDILSSIQEKLQLKDLNNVFYKTVVAGYMEPEPVELDSMNSDFVSQQVGEWLTSRKVLNVPLFEFKRNFTNKTYNLDKVELKLALEEMRKDREKSIEK